MNEHNVVFAEIDRRCREMEKFLSERIAGERRFNEEVRRNDKEYYEEIRQGDMSLIKQYQDLADRALKIAESNDQRHFEALNQAKDTLKNQNETYATKSETTALRETMNEIKLNYAPLGTLKAVSDKADRSEGKLNNLDGRMAVAAIGLTLIMFVITVASRFIGN